MLELDINDILLLQCSFGMKPELSVSLNEPKLKKMKNLIQDFKPNSYKQYSYQPRRKHNNLAQLDLWYN